MRRAKILKAFLTKVGENYQMVGNIEKGICFQRKLVSNITAVKKRHLYSAGLI